jgi:hypothetical protein
LKSTRAGFCLFGHINRAVAPLADHLHQFVAVNQGTSGLREIGAEVLRRACADGNRVGGLAWLGAFLQRLQQGFDPLPGGFIWSTGLLEVRAARLGFSDLQRPRDNELLPTVFSIQATLGCLIS